MRSLNCSPLPRVPLPLTFSQSHGAHTSYTAFLLLGHLFYEHLLSILFGPGTRAGTTGDEKDG